jgi:hypothetical protein
MIPPMEYYHLNRKNYEYNEEWTEPKIREEHLCDPFDKVQRWTCDKYHNDQRPPMESFKIPVLRVSFFQFFDVVY